MRTELLTCAGMALYSVKTPSMGAPNALALIAAVTLPWMWLTAKLDETRSPTVHPLTSSPTATISPAMSDTGTRFSFWPSGYSPLATIRSRCYTNDVHVPSATSEVLKQNEMQTCRETAWIFTRTSVDLSLGIGASFRVRLWNPSAFRRRYSRVVFGRSMMAKRV